ncbi:MAG: hypothetical protein N5P05_000941 [Chroococcopsis gigantea SAG 12.99]|jgi:hypothetical protein|nr:hypothetical protein [Chlorogloea purpurea SAG 13.99]MDV2999335.1 hypothetical protein [Chroococcopsis gigantea SAG 12.99]
MSYQYSSFDCTCTNFEQAALNRFRSLAGILPSNCRVFRENWHYSSVLCLDLVNCPAQIETLHDRVRALIETSQRLGLGNAIIFKMGNKIIGWHR